MSQPEKIAQYRENTLDTPPQAVRSDLITPWWLVGSKCPDGLPDPAVMTRPTITHYTPESCLGKPGLLSRPHLDSPLHNQGSVSNRTSSVSIGLTIYSPGGLLIDQLGILVPWQVLCEAWQRTTVLTRCSNSTRVLAPIIQLSRWGVSLPILFKAFRIDTDFAWIDLKQNILCCIKYIRTCKSMESFMIWCIQVWKEVFFHMFHNGGIHENLLLNLSC